MKTNRTIMVVGLLAVTTLAVLLLVNACGRSEGGAAAKAPYHCPMHPAVVSDQPGDCPICGMRLVPIETAQAVATTAPASARAAARSGKVTKYRSTMNPGEVSDRPGKDSMGMQMVPFEVEAPAEATLDGLATVSITPVARARMGLTLGNVERRDLTREVRTSAIVVPDETRLYRVTTKLDGWVDELFVNVTGQQVRRGDPVLSIYSPELVRAQQEYLAALAQLKARESDPAGTASFAATLVEAARRRLQLWDISDEQIQRLAQTGQVEKSMTLLAPASGYVVEKSVLAGQKIMPGDSLLVIADLSQVWADANVYQPDLAYVKEGMPIRLSVPYLEGRTFQGRVVFVSPTLDPDTRTIKARLAIDNRELLLKPGMFADAVLDFALGKTLAIPESAVMRTGEHPYAFKDAVDGRLVPVVVRLGPQADGYYQLLEGLSEGDHVVTSANFLVDSESSLKAALQALAPNPPPETGPSAQEHRP